MAVTREGLSFLSDNLSKSVDLLSSWFKMIQQ